MAGCMLRVAGRDLDLEDCLNGCDFSPVRVFGKGQERLGRRGGTWERNGFHVVVSDCDGDHAEQQVQDAQAFIEEHHDALAELAARSDVEAICLDFGLYFWVEMDASKSVTLPPGLLKICGELGVEIEVSMYATADK